MDGRSHNTDVVVTRPSQLEASIEVLRMYVEAVQMGDGPVAEFHEAEREIRRACAAIECAATGAVLEAYEALAAEIEVDGKRYRRLEPASEATYMGMAGGLRVSRHLYREQGVRNGPTVVPLELNAGIVEGWMTPEAAQATAFLAQALPSREATETARQLGVLPSSRTSKARIGSAMGQRWAENRQEAEDHLIDSIEIAPEAAGISVAIDRVSVPMAEPRERRPDEPADRPPKQPIEVVYRMAYCAVLTLHDREGEPLRSIRYGQMPSDDASTEIVSSMAGDLATLLTIRPDLRVVTLADGAPEMQRLLDQATSGQDVSARLIDFWHLIEKLAVAIAATKRDVGPKLAAWKTKLLERDNAIEHIDIELETWALEYDGEPLPDGLYDALTYIENNRDRMRYASVRAKNLPIGSGHVEATCKTIVSTRMKRAGARWKYDGGQAIIQLRALATSSLWDDAMRFLLGTYRRTVSECWTQAA